MSPQGRHEFGQIGFGAELGIELAEVAGVVAMRAAGLCFEQGRGVNVTNTQFAEIRHQRVGIMEGEAAMKLQPICCARNGGNRAHPFTLKPSCSPSSLK